ncbi:MAG: glycosyl transferase [Rickettsiales bacterium TMED174]|nr:MAG: glycosyl transferase [Rickettsiales bacterium TMED174]|tara:strand:+ start:27 stop:683 length:657 start_codon:yes stop_codon:yes gene_type:complete
MKNKPKLSVIIPVYNQEKYLGRCLRSLMSQTLPKNEYEIIVIDDGSVDNTSFVLQTFKNDIIVKLNKKNKGLPYSINKGIIASKARFIVRVDSDDYVNEQFLNILYTFISSNTEIDAFACDYYTVDDKEKFLERVNCQSKPIGCGIIFRVEQLIEIGMYDKKFLVHEDKDLRLRFQKKFKINRIPIPLYRYRKHSTNITNNKKELKKHYKLFKKKHKK